MQLAIAVEQEEEGRWLRQKPAQPGVLASGQTRAEAVTPAQILALRVLADRKEEG